MRYKKITAIILSTILFTASFGGIITSYAKNDSKDTAANETINIDKMQTSKAPNPNITDLDPELSDNNSSQCVDITTDSQLIGQDHNWYAGDIITGGIKEENVNAIDQKLVDRYNFGKEEVEELLQAGYSITDICEADEIGNQLGIDPIELLQIRKNTSKTLKNIREDILIDRKDKASEYLKNKYPKEYKKMKDSNISDEEIIIFFSEIEIRDIEPSDNLIKDYKEKGSKLFDDLDTVKTKDKNDKDDNGKNTASSNILTAEEDTK